MLRDLTVLSSVESVWKTGENINYNVKVNFQGTLFYLEIIKNYLPMELGCIY